MKSKNILRLISLLVLLATLVPASTDVVRAAAVVPPADMFQLPWEQGLAWVSLDGFDTGFKRPSTSPHNYLQGGAIDFAPRKNMVKGEDTSRYWVTAAAGGTVISMTTCSLKIDHGNGWVSDYQFLAKFQVKVGDVVYRNQKLGIIADGVRYKFCLPDTEPDIPHLHFALRPNMRDASFAGWTVNYNTLFNRTTFTKGSVTVGQYQPLLNTFDGLQIVDRGLLPWDAAQTGSVDTYRYERWSLALSETTKFTLTATPNTANLVPLLVLTDANGNELARGTGTLSTTQNVGNYFVQVQPQVANGFYILLAHKETIPVPTGPYVSTSVTPTSINAGTSALVAVSLHNIPAEGYTSAELTCTYNAGISEISNITMLSLFGADPVYVVNGPQNGSFIVAIAGSNGNRAMTDGNAFTFDIRGLQAGQTALECKARVSKGDKVLSDIEWLGTVLNITSVMVPTPTPGPTIVPPTPILETTPSPTPTSAFPPSTPTISPTMCNQAESTGYINIAPGTTVTPGASLYQEWGLRNIGWCTWTLDYQLVLTGGDQMGSALVVGMPMAVEPGQLIIIRVPFVSPTTLGHYASTWMLKEPSGTQFGVGDTNNQPLLIDINVADATLTPTAGTPVSTLSPTPTPYNNWLTFTNVTYGFQFNYPNDAQIVSGGNDNGMRINLPFAQTGTNLSEKYLEMIVRENVDPCVSPLQTQNPSEQVTINNITYTKQTGTEGVTGHTYKWVAYSTLRNNACISMDFILKSVNPGFVTLEPPVYDEAAESYIFGQIISTLSFLTQFPTITPSVPAPTFTPAVTSTSGAFPTPTAASGDGTVTGKVTASKPATVGLYDSGGSLVTSIPAGADGLFLLTAPAGTYTLVAVASGFLNAQGSVTLIGGSTITQSNVTLIAGDIDNNGVIDQFDAMTIGMAYNTSTPAAADLNNDGVINVLDLETLAKNYRKTGPVAW
jgi:murein DD-endopeptidase MepM/ murein hydrolase activator NlpD